MLTVGRRGHGEKKRGWWSSFCLLFAATAPSRMAQRMISEESCMVLCEARYLAGRVDTESTTESLYACVCETESDCARTCVRGGTLCQTLLRRVWENEANEPCALQ